ncbi:MAG: hypothetical protein NZ874_05215, partial [Fimbriimonadales bacterium]|nr:hypothetical protein [Fimbriimonadales bacterium]
MRPHTRTIWMGALALGLAGTVCADVVLYAGQPTADTGIALRNWGAGTIEDSTETSFTGNRSLKVLTRGALSGGWIVFGTPVDLRADLNAPNKAMRFTLRFPLVGGGAGGGVGFGTPPPPSAPGGAPPLGGDRGVPPPREPSNPAGSGQTTPPPLRELRLIFETSEGKRTEAILPLQNLRTDESGWQSASLPLRTVSELRETSGRIAKLGIFGDTSGVFYIGEIRIVSESGTLQGYIAVQNTYGSVFTSRSHERLTIATGDELIFFGVTEGVTTPVEYRWS